MAKIEEFENPFQINILEYHDGTFGIALETKNIKSLAEAETFASLLAEWMVAESGAYRLVSKPVQ